MEYENPRLDEELLRSIAKAGGENGFYVSIDKLREVPPKIPPREEKITRESSIDLWDNAFVLLVFTLLLTAEWLLRKWGRMI